MTLPEVRTPPRQEERALEVVTARHPLRWLALKSGRVQAYFGPNPSIAYNIAVSGGSRIVGTLSGAGPDLLSRQAS